MIMLRSIMVFGAIALVWSILWAMGADGRSLGVVLAEMRSAPWSVVTMIDLYLGFFLSAIIMFYVENRWSFRIFWILPVFFLGNIWTAIWLIIRLPKVMKRFHD